MNLYLANGDVLEAPDHEGLVARLRDQNPTARDVSVAEYIECVIPFLRGLRIGTDLPRIPDGLSPEAFLRIYCAAGMAELVEHDPIPDLGIRLRWPDEGDPHNEDNEDG